MEPFDRARASAAIFSIAVLIVAIFRLAGATLGPAPANAAPPTSDAPVIDPAAKESLARMVQYLRTLDAFAVRAQTSREEVLARNFKIERNNEVDITMKRPDRLRAFANGDDGRRTFVYDGKSLALHIEPENYVATTASPPTIREMLD